MEGAWLSRSQYNPSERFVPYLTWGPPPSYWSVPEILSKLEPNSLITFVLISKNSWGVVRSHQNDRRKFLSFKNETVEARSSLFFLDQSLRLALQTNPIRKR